MPKFDLSVPHSLGREAALERLQGFSDQLREKHGDKVSDFRQEWSGDRLDFGFKTFGIAIDGGLTVRDDQVNVDGNLPMTAAMFKGQITSAIREQLEKLLA
ncbi:polyhydroxyalkanoic acid system family protein [Botrimarina sp.]|uniref:polyhydroxyalkanoic acid system family protein n=1 Tax=Botrimarina sp. TaxID=2795802 RepID=UPI0032EFEFE0